jgi:hypothetical protein
MSVCLTIFMTIYLRRENARRDALSRERGVDVADLSDEMALEEREKGDEAEFFRYTV